MKACALICLHLMAEENAWRSDCGSSASSSTSCENNVGNDALFVIGLQGSGDTIALFLQDWEVAKVALSCHVVLDMLWTEHPHTAYFLAHSFAHMHLYGSSLMSSRVWLRVVSSNELFLSFECLYLLSILFISSVLVIILHVVATAEY